MRTLRTVHRRLRLPRAAKHRLHCYLRRFRPWWEARLKATQATAKGRLATPGWQVAELVQPSGASAASPVAPDAA